MSFSFLDQEFSKAFEKVIVISEQCLNLKTQTDLQSLHEQHIKLKIFLTEGIKQELDHQVVYCKDPFNYVTVLSSINQIDKDRGLVILSASLIYLYLHEYKFRKGEKNLNQETIGFINTFQISVKSALDHIGSEPYPLTYANNELVFDILQDVFHSENYEGLKNIQSNVKEIKLIIDNWNRSLEDKKQEIVKIENRLAVSKSTYDFVLLNKGFKELYEQKKLELKERRNGYSSFGATLAITPLLLIIFSFIGFWLKGEEILKYLLYVMFPVSTFMLIILYFVRVSLQHVRSVQSQMMQLELRMALCQFIHNYAEDSEKLHKKNPAGFERFENIIFSPLVSSDDKIPTTFDGMEQLAKLVSEFRK